jgi:hypothetical protein
VKTSILVLSLLLVGLTACNPYLYQASAPPPARAGRLDPVSNFWGIKRYRMEVSEGVAVAVQCQDGGPCEHMKVTSDNPAIAEVRMAALSQLQTNNYTGYGTAPTAAFVVVGKAAGATKVHVSTKDGYRVVTVTVIAPPAPVNAQTAAK